jgi:hypothetical protein
VRTPADKRLALAWAALVAITLSYLVVERSAGHHGGPHASTVASVTAIGLALVKLRIILRELMDVRHAPRVLRTLTDALVVTMAAAMLGTYLVGQAAA